MRRYLTIVAVLALVLISTGVVAADQLELTKRINRDGDVERLVVDDQTNQVTVEINGTVVATRPANERELEALQRQKASERNEAGRATLQSLITDMKGRPSSDPDVLRAEQVIIELARMHGVE